MKMNGGRSKEAWRGEGGQKLVWGVKSLCQTVADMSQVSLFSVVLTLPLIHQQQSTARVSLCSFHTQDRHYKSITEFLPAELETGFRILPPPRSQKSLLVSRYCPGESTHLPSLHQPEVLSPLLPPVSHDSHLACQRSQAFPSGQEDSKFRDSSQVIGPGTVSQKRIF